MSNYTLAHCSFGNRTELHTLLHLTGAEVSLNTLPAGTSVPFVHRHKENEEIYIVTEGSGYLQIDGEELPLHAGDCFRIDPAGERRLLASETEAISFICVQVKAGSLGGFTMEDAVLVES